MSSQAYLALADGTVFNGVSCGAACDLPGEAVFNTGMSGYQEIVSDPSYFGQIVTLSTAEVGNYGCNDEDMESRGVFLNGLVVQNLNPPSSWRSRRSLDDLLKNSGRPILSGVDTRRLVLHIRENGTQKAWLHADGTDLPVEEAVAKARAWSGLDGLDCAAEVAVAKPYNWSDKGDLHVVVIDCGVKYNILRQLAANGFRVTVVPCGTTAEVIFNLRPDGVLLSNTWGAGNRDSRINQAFLLKEIEAGAKIGVDVIQIDDGWQHGRTANSQKKANAGKKKVWSGYWDEDPDFWKEDLERFPDGLAFLVGRAKEKGMRFGLWFGPDSSNEAANWQRDADCLLDYHRRLGIDYFKMDSMRLLSQTALQRNRMMFDRMLELSDGAMVFDLDCTAQVRPGFLGLLDIGPLFLENRYTKRACVTGDSKKAIIRDVLKVV